MQKILLVSVNSSFSHTNIAVRYLKYYAEKFSSEVTDAPCAQTEFCDFTINQPLGEIIRGINSRNPDVILFSTYIWNVESVVRIAKNIKALKPELIVGAGGPEVGFRGSDFLKENPDFDLIIKGEGEETFRQLAVAAVETSGKNFLESLKKVKGIFLRETGSGNSESPVIFTGEQDLICDLGVLPFPYPDLETLDPDHKIFYYESSRGCPFSCAYCMSSLDTKVRFVPLEKVYADLQCFLDAGVALVKFVDRTYNLKPERYVGIWKYIMEHHNGKTMFHFEIEGEFLSEEAMEFLQTVPEGIMQFEIGVQSSNPAVLKACGRSPETETLRRNILRIPKTIHTHLDLIAGLPFEDLESFGRSFDFVMNMKPDALQLGFLKILYGAPVNNYCASEPGWKWMKTPPYEVLETPYLRYEEILFLKDLETCLDAYWNDHHFDTVMKYLSGCRVGTGMAASGTDATACGTCGAATPSIAACGTFGAAAVPAGDQTLGAHATVAAEASVMAASGTSGEPMASAVTLSGDSATASGTFGAATVPTGGQTLGGHVTAAVTSDIAASGTPAAWWQLFVSLTAWLRAEGAFSVAHQKDYWAQMLHRYVTESGELEKDRSATANELLRFDFISGGKKTNPPAWLVRRYDDQSHYDALQKTTGIKHSRLDFVYSDFDTFSVNPLNQSTWWSGSVVPGDKVPQGDTATVIDASRSGEPAVHDQSAASYKILFLYPRKESDRPSDFQRKPHQLLISD